MLDLKDVAMGKPFLKEFREDVCASSVSAALGSRWSRSQPTSGHPITLSKKLRQGRIVSARAAPAGCSL
jgi:hypothetical protein